MRIEKAKTDDVREIMEIYNDAILNTTATFDLEIKSYEDRMDWFNKHDEFHPVLTAKEKGEVAGFARLSRAYEKKAYEGTCELTIYVKENFKRRGVGNKLMKELLEAALRTEPVSYTHLTIHKDVTDRLLHINPALAKQARVVLDVNKSERHIRGGMATKEKYLHKKSC